MLLFSLLTVAAAFAPSPAMMEDLVLKEMIADDKRNLTADEIANLNNRFGNLFQGTAFGGILQVQQSDQSVDPEAEIAQKLNTAPVDPRLVLSTSATKPIIELKDQSVLDFEDFKALSSRPSTSGGAQAQNNDERAFEEGFKDFRHLKSLRSKSEARNINQEKEMLTFNNSGMFSGGLVSSQRPDAFGLGSDVKGRVWHDSERSGRRPNYTERHSPVKGFTSTFDRKGDGADRQDGGDPGAIEQHLVSTGGRQLALADSPANPQPLPDADPLNFVTFQQPSDQPDLEGSKRKLPSRSRASQIKRSRRQSTEESGAVMKDAQLLQCRLEAAWTKLETPMIKKLQYLEKYSDNTFSAKLTASVELWERASVLVPLRERSLKLLKGMKTAERISPNDILKQLSGIKGTSCYVELPLSFSFEQRLDAGEVVDEELLAVFETFDDRGDPSKDVYMIESRAWLEQIIANLDYSIRNLSADLQKEVKEMVSFRGIPYVISTK